MHKYETIIYWSNEDQVFIAEVPELPGCMAHGETKSAALANADEAIQLWIDTAKEFGDLIPKPKVTRTTSNSLVKTKYGAEKGGRGSSVRRNNPRAFFSARAPQPTTASNPEAH